MNDGNADANSGGLRARKRLETLRKLTDEGVRLFIEKSYETVTIEEIAAAAGVSRRTFFHYFKSKDDVLLSLQAQIGDMIAVEIGATPLDITPLEAVRRAAVKVCAAVPGDEMIALDRLMRESPSVQARKQASYVEHERTLFTALRARWPDPNRASRLRLVAMIGIGAMRLSSEVFNEEGGTRPIEQVLDACFKAIEAEILD